MRADWRRMRRDFVSHAEKRAWDSAKAHARQSGVSRLLEMAVLFVGFGIAIAVAMDRHLYGLAIAEVAVVILLAVLSQLLPLLNLMGRVRCRALRRKFPRDVVVGAYVSDSIKEAIARAGRYKPPGRFAMTISLVFTHEGVSMWRGGFVPRHVADVPWASVSNVGTAERRDHGVRFGELVFSSSIGLPKITFSLQPARFFDLAVPTREELQSLADRIEELREHSVAG